MLSAIRSKILCKRVRTGHIFVLFSILGILAFSLVLFPSARTLEKGDQRQLEKEIQRYLVNSDTHTSHMQVGLPFIDLSALGELGFVAFIREKEHTVFTSPQLPLSMKTLVSLSPETPDGWTHINDQNLVITTHEIGPQTYVQAGMIADNYQLYKTIKESLLFIALLYCLTTFIIARKLSSWNQKPVDELCRLLDELGDKSSSKNLPKTEGELSALYDKINGLLLANTKIKGEIQASLDNLAHDLRTPIARLRSTAEYGLQKPDTKDLQEALGDCLEESEHIAAILQVMLSVAEAESGTMQLVLKEENLSRNIVSALELYEYTAEEKNIRLDLIADENIFCPIDVTRMRQVWANLLDNGIKYGRVGGEVVVRVWQEDNLAYISFSDNGMGISQKEIPRIWERLYRGDRSRTEKGLGLGLNYVRSVIKAHGGTISVTSKLEQETCFTITLPLAVTYNNNTQIS